MGDGSTTEFTFNFPYFENTNIIVTKNNAAATGYSIVGTSAAPDADIPYTGGKVVFETAPSAMDCITIARQLPLSRIVDYQPTAKIEPTTLNQDVNYLMEVIKDRKDEIDTLCTQYSDIADKESTTTLLARIATIHDEIVAVSAQITALGDISTLRTDVTTNTGNIATNTGNIATNTSNIATLDTRTNGLFDYVIAYQAPTADNNYTWYRKYKSGWVEQGGRANTSENGTTCTLPITMSDTNYFVQVTVSGESSSNYSTSAKSKQKTYITISTYTEVRPCDWMVCGFAAA